MPGRNPLERLCSLSRSAELRPGESSALPVQPHEIYSHPPPRVRQQPRSTLLAQHTLLAAPMPSLPGTEPSALAGPHRSVKPGRRALEIRHGRSVDTAGAWTLPEVSSRSGQRQAAPHSSAKSSRRCGLRAPVTAWEHGLCPAGAFVHLCICLLVFKFKAADVEPC